MYISTNEVENLKEAYKDYLNLPVQIDGSYEFQAFVNALAMSKEPRESWKEMTEIKVGELEDLADAESFLKAGRKKAFNFVAVDNMGDFKFKNNTDHKPMSINVNGWTYDSIRSLGISQKGKTVAIYYNVSTKKVVVFIEDYVYDQIVDMICVFLFKFAPWWFNESEAKAWEPFAKSLILTDYKDSEVAAVKTAMIAYCNKVFEESHLKDEIQAQFFRRMVRMPLEAERRALENAANQINSNITDATEELERMADRQKELKANILFWSESYAKLPDRIKEFEIKESKLDESEMVNFFNQHKDIMIEKMEDNDIYLSIHSLLTGYSDEDMVKMFNHKDCCFRSNEYYEYLKSIFCDHTGLLPVIGKVRLHNMSRVHYYNDPARHRAYASDPDTMMSPHWYANCQGANAASYEKFSESGQWDMLIEQVCWAVSNWNPFDHVISSDVNDYWEDDRNREKKNIWVHPDLSPIYDVDDSCIKVSIKEFKEMKDAKEASTNG